MRTFSWLGLGRSSALGNQRLTQPLTLQGTHQSGMASVPGTAFIPLLRAPPQGLIAVMCWPTAPVSSDPAGTMWQSLRVSDHFRSPFQIGRCWKVGFRLGMICNYRCLHLLFPFEGNNMFVFSLLKLRLNKKAVLFSFKYWSKQWLVREPWIVSEWVIGSVLSSMTSFLSKSV